VTSKIFFEKLLINLKSLGRIEVHPKGHTISPSIEVDPTGKKLTPMGKGLLLSHLFFNKSSVLIPKG
jgi:hypothetical protein